MNIKEYDRMLRDMQWLEKRVTEQERLMQELLLGLSDIEKVLFDSKFCMQDGARHSGAPFHKERVRHLTEKIEQAHSRIRKIRNDFLTSKQVMEVDNEEE